MKNPELGRGRPYMMAMVLGTALSALGTTTGTARAAEPAERTITHLSRYCTACWRNARLPADRWGDCTQEVFRRLLDRVGDWERLLAKETEERRELVRAIDAVKKRTLREGKRAVGLVGPVPDHRDRLERNRREDREAVRLAAGALLSPRQRKILDLAFEGWSIADIGKALSLHPDRVSDEKYKAVRKLRNFFQS